MSDSNALDLDSPYALTEQQVRSFRECGFVKLKNVLSPATIAHYGDAITAEVKRLNRQTKPMHERNAIGGKAKVKLAKGDVLRVITPGGGGFGSL